MFTLALLPTLLYFAENCLNYINGAFSVDDLFIPIDVCLSVVSDLLIQ